MNPGEILEAIEELVLDPFDRAEFPFLFLRAFGNKDTAIQRLRAGNTNQSDVPDGVLQRGNIHRNVSTQMRQPDWEIRLPRGSRGLAG